MVIVLKGPVTFCASSPENRSASAPRMASTSAERKIAENGHLHTCAFCAEPDGILPYRQRPDGAVQLALCTAYGRDICPADRGHRCGFIGLGFLIVNFDFSGDGEHLPNLTCSGLVYFQKSLKIFFRRLYVFLQCVQDLVFYCPGYFLIFFQKCLHLT